MCIHRPARAADTPAGPQGRAPKFGRRCSWVGSHESGPLGRLEGMSVSPAAESSRAWATQIFFSYVLAWCFSVWLEECPFKVSLGANLTKSFLGKCIWI